MQKEYPKHIAIILDGNRRWAKEKGLKPWQGHLEGYKNVKRVFDWVKELNIKEITLYGFSLENKSRSSVEVSALYKLFTKAFKELLADKRIWDNKVKINHIGNLELFPKDLQKVINDSVEKTKQHDNYVVNFALAYGGRQEITNATKIIVDKVLSGEINKDEINEQTVEDNLYIQSEPDILIRPGGEQRISNFLLWQISYTELFFIQKYWPDFSKDDLKKIINQYLNRNRRFGK
jgi:tritrans,polycis-undecaprenyl-diphosphate synthase [geranylgeranyl-diphosphate specific]